MLREGRTLADIKEPVQRLILDRSWAAKQVQIAERSVWVARLLDFRSENQHTPVSAAAARGEPAILKLILDNGGSPNQPVRVHSVAVHRGDIILPAGGVYGRVVAGRHCTPGGKARSADVAPVAGAEKVRTGCVALFLACPSSTVQTVCMYMTLCVPPFPFFSPSEGEWSYANTAFLRRMRVAHSSTLRVAANRFRRIRLTSRLPFCEAMYNGHAEVRCFVSA